MFVCSVDMPTSEYLDYLAQRRYTKSGTEDLPDPYGIPEDMWLEDITKWPHLEFGDLYTYLIESKGPYIKQSLKA